MCLAHTLVPDTQKEHNKCVKLMPPLHLAPLSTLLQAMRFPPKSYNKDLESAEVSCPLLRVQLEDRTSLQKGKRGRFWKGCDSCEALARGWVWLGEARSERPTGPWKPSPHPICFPRSGVSESSKTWSLLRRWQRMMMTASLELGGWGRVG